MRIRRHSPQWLRDHHIAAQQPVCQKVGQRSVGRDPVPRTMSVRKALHGGGERKVTGELARSDRERCQSQVVTQPPRRDA
jgi:hypothetical protein